MLTTITLGVLASVATEAVNWLNQKLTDTVLHGKASFLLALFISLAIAAIKTGASDVSLTDLPALGTYFAQIWATAQIFFVIVIEGLGLDVQEKQG